MVNESVEVEEVVADELVDVDLHHEGREPDLELPLEVEILLFAVKLRLLQKLQNLLLFAPVIIFIALEIFFQLQKIEN